jgi:hypothetical protein
VLPIVPAADARPELGAAISRYREVAGRFPPFRDYFKYRLRATTGVGLLIIGQIAALWLARQRRVPDALCIALLVPAWASIAWWLYDRYLV